MQQCKIILIIYRIKLLQGILFLTFNLDEFILFRNAESWKTIIILNLISKIKKYKIVFK